MMTLKCTSIDSAKQIPAMSDIMFPNAAATIVDNPKVIPNNCSIDSPADIYN